MKFINDIKAIFCDKYAQVLMALFSIVFGLVKSLSEFVYDKNEINVDIQSGGVYALICYLLLNIAYYVITRDYKVKSVEIKSPRKLWWSFFAILFLSYTICWLTYWPGLVFIDNWIIARIGMDMSVQHPISYCAIITYLTKLSLWLGSINYSVIFYVFIQLLIVCAVLASVCLFIYQSPINKILKMITILCYIFIPVYPMYAISSVKDVLWSVFTAVVPLSIYKLISHPNASSNKRFWILFDTSLVAIVLFRNNGPYVALLCLIPLFFICRQHKRHLMIVLGCVVLSLGVAQLALRGLNKEELFQERVCAPIQQIAAVVKNDGVLTDQQKDFINQMMPLENLKQAYDPYAVDAIRWKGKRQGFDKNFLQQHKSEFLKTWLELMPQNFAIYVKAFLQANYWFWTPAQWKYMYIKEKTPKEGELRDWVFANGYVERQIFSETTQKYLKKYYETKFFFSEGILFWLLSALALLYYLRRRTAKDLIIYLPCLLVWLTVMLSAPQSFSFRYVLPLAYLLPVFIILLFVDKNKEKPDIATPLSGHKALSDKNKHTIKFIATIFVGICVLVSATRYLITGIPVKARFDLSVPYSENQTFIAIKNNKELPEAGWMPKYDNRGYIIEKKGNKYNFILIAFEDADIKIVLRGPDERDANGKRIEKWVRYTDFSIDGKKILLNPTDVWHDNAFRYTLKAKKNHPYKIKLKWRKK